MPNADYTYEGSELLETFARAQRWKRYVRSRIQGAIGQRVVEVGAGIGSNTTLLCGLAEQWTCVEPDAAMARGLVRSIADGALPAHCSVVCGTLSSLPAGERVDTVLYYDVLEHIFDDAGEVRAAAERLATGGHLIVLSPAHQWLFTAFDAAVGHHRRYTKQMIAALTPPALRMERLEYLDSIGLLASLGNRLVLRSDHPTVAQVLTWDRLMVPLSRVIDPLLGYRAGKSVLAIWQRC